MNRHPVLEPLRVHHDVVDRLGRRGDVRACARPSSRPQRLERLPLGAARARPRARSASGRMPYRRGASAGSRGSRSDSRLSISGRTSSSGWPVTAATTAAAGGVSEAPRPSGVRPTPIASAIRSIISRVGEHVRPGHVQRAAGRARHRRRAGEVLDHVALGDRLGAVAAPGRQRQHAQPLDQAHEDAERGRAGADHDRGAQGGRARHGVEQDALDLEARAQVRRRARRRSARCRRGRRSARRPAAAAALAKPSAARRSRSAKPSPFRAAPPSSAPGSRRWRSRRAPRSRPAPVSRSPRTGSTPASGSTALGPARQRAHGAALAGQASQQARADVSGGSGDQLHRVLHPFQNPLGAGRRRFDPGNCSKRKNLRFAASPLVGAGRTVVGWRGVPKTKPARCEDCYFHQNMLCALNLDKPCTTFRPAERGPRPRAPAGLRLPRRAHHGGLRLPAAERLTRACKRPRPGGRSRLKSQYATDGPGQVALLAGRRRGVFGVSARGEGHGRAAGLRQRRVRQAAPAHRLRGRGRGRDLAPARRPLPRPGPVLVRAHLRAAPAAGAGGPLAGHRQPRAAGAARAARARARRSGGWSAAGATTT